MTPNSKTTDRNVHRTDQQRVQDAERQYVSLGIDREVFAVSVSSVREILDMRPIWRLPEAPPYLAGVIEVRGQAVPTIDLRRKLGLPSMPPTETTRILVLDIPLARRTLSVALIADRVFEVIDLDAQEITSPPDIGDDWRCAYISGIARRNDGFVMVVDLRLLFSVAELDAIGGAAASPALSAASGA